MKKHRGRHLLSLLASAALLASLLPAAFAAEAEGEKHITILGTSDMHGNIWGYSYEDNAETDNNGMARLYTYIQQVRAENPNTFLVDAGDDIQGTIMTDDLYNKTPEEPHPVVTAMNYMGYDAMTLGNHEFNWGIPTMQTILGQASFPVLAANVTDAQGEPVTGAELKAYMEWSAECYNQWQEGDINLSFDPEYPDYLYDMFAGVDYEIDLSQPKGQRIQNVMFHGAPLQDDQELTLAVNNYRYSSALKAQNIISGTKEWESSNSIRDMIVAYFAEHSPVAPEVDHNWKIVGVDLSEDDPRRAELVGYINAGLLDTPYAESYNLSDYDSLVAQAKAKAETLTVTVNGAAKDVATAFDAQGNTYYRLRDLAFALKGTGAQFNVTWDGSVAVATGSAYEGEALAMPGSAPTGEAVSLTLTVDGTAVSQPAVLVNGNYYLAEGFLAQLGAESALVEGVLAITAA